MIWLILKDYTVLEMNFGPSIVGFGSELGSNSGGNLT